MTARCVLSDLDPDQCACRLHRGDPGRLETLTDLGSGPASRGGVRVELGATFDNIIARWTATTPGRCGIRGCGITEGSLIGRDNTGVLVCTNCLPDRGALK